MIRYERGRSEEIARLIKKIKTDHNWRRDLIWLGDQLDLGCIQKYQYVTPYLKVNIRNVLKKYRLDNCLVIFY